MPATEFPTVQAVVVEMKKEILDLIKLQVIPANVSSFSELHDYIDANMLAEDIFPPQPDFTDDDAVEAYYEKANEIFNPASTQVSLWLSNYRPMEDELTEGTRVRVGRREGAVGIVDGPLSRDNTDPRPIAGGTLSGGGRITVPLDFTADGGSYGLNYIEDVRVLP